MANFHSNLLVIAANEEDMRKVLQRFALNLAANENNVGHARSSINGSESLSELLDMVAAGIDSNYWLAFAGAPIAQSSDAEDNVRTVPTTRPLSETASVNYARQGDAYVLSIYYETAWNKNDEDVDLFFEGLPSGEYGVSCFDADEGSGYYEVNVICVLHCGQAVLNSYDFSLEENVSMCVTDPNTGLERFVGIDEMSEDEFNEFARDATVCYHGPVKDAHELKKEAGDLSSIGRHAIPKLAELSYSVAVSDWFRYVDYDDLESFKEAPREMVPREEGTCAEEDAGESRAYGLSGAEPSLFGCLEPTLNWEHPSSDEYARIDEEVFAVLKRFPWVVGSTGAAYEEREKNVERLVPGQPIKLVADWENLYFNPVAIQTQTASGERLGNLDDRGGGMQLSADARAALACILPHVRAYADRVEPLMTVCGGTKRNSTIIVRLELTDEPLDNLLEEVHKLLEGISSSRSLSSVVEKW